MKESSVRLGILGAGRVVTNRYIDVFNNEVTGVSVTNVVDKVSERAEYVAEQLGARVLETDDELFQSSDTDVILIATESGNHDRHTRQSLESGKHVIVEKPAALFENQIAENATYAKKKGLMYATILQNRLNPAIKLLKETHDLGRFGKKVVSTIRLRWCRYQSYYDDGWHGTWLMDGGVINQQAYHHLDALQWISGEISTVSSAWTNTLNDLEAEDTMVAVLKFADGSLGTIEATTAARPDDFEASISVVGEKGMAVIGGIALNKIETWDFIGDIYNESEIKTNYSQSVPTGYGLSHGPLVQEIVDRLMEGNSTAPISGKESMPVTRLVHALYKSAEDSSWVKLEPNIRSALLGV